MNKEALDSAGLPEPQDRTEFPFGFHVSRDAWKVLGLIPLLDSEQLEPGGDTAIRRARELAARANEHPGFRYSEEVPLHTGEVLAYGLLSDVFRFLTRHYCLNINPGVIARAMHADSLPEEVRAAMRAQEVFVDEVPPVPVLKADTSRDEYLEAGGKALPNRDSVMLELLLLHLAMGNPAVHAYRKLHDDALLDAAQYKQLVAYLERALADETPYPGIGKSLVQMLRDPIQASPYSLDGQLGFIQRNYKALLPEHLLERIHRVQDVLQEETKMRGFGPGPSHAPVFGVETPGYEEAEAFSEDKAWMPNLALIAKSTYVWLDQLSKKYKRDIVHLDQIPDEELDMLAQWGFSGLWLIGLWERSDSSKMIKRRMGNPEAESSAYSIYDYTIAQDLGGETAYQQLAVRAWKRGIRLASDMVPNHFGIYSRWVVEHPDWFVQTSYPPFPGYKFNGPDVSPDDRVGLYLEDGYWDHSDAAVVFKWQNKLTQETRYIYHGNDGTNMPWNDTAQLNFLIPELREAVIQTILHVARMFPIIRFDAAMTLAKQHYQRLWYPVPGKGGDIPSRAEHGLSRAQFDAVFPVEFWREVVDRVALEAPDTLLLAEAFWLMEGYFVRTLGMHRVYNSAFMNMLKLEENSKYRQTIKNVLEFSPEILQRFVNFMNNPDEESAEAQFGKGDKYFGVATLMVTLPGLPMFGHGQIEGFGEKYGMEYRRAYWDESVDTGLVQRHEREIFPLLRRRHIFSGSRHFALMDFEHAHGGVDENVYGFVNRNHSERALIVFNNAFSQTQGSLKTSTAINLGTAHEPNMVHLGLAQALGLNLDERCYYIYRDQNTGMERLAYAQDIAQQGLYFDLRGYQCCVLLDWHEVIDTDLSWARLHTQLQGRSVENVWEAYQELNLHKVLEPFEAFMKTKNLDIAFKENATEKELDVLFLALETYYTAVAEHVRSKVDVPEFIAEIRMAFLGHKKNINASIEENSLKRMLVFWALLRRMGTLIDSDDLLAGEARSAVWMREWFLTKYIALGLHQWGLSSEKAWDEARLVRIVMAFRHDMYHLQGHSWGPLLVKFLHDGDVNALLRTNPWQGRHWISKEAWEYLLNTLLLVLTFESKQNGKPPDALLLAQDDIQTLLAAAGDVGYDRDALLDVVK